MAASPYGFWTSPLTSDLVVADSIRLEQVALDGDAIYWTETQPHKHGRIFVYRVGADGEPERVTRDDANTFSVRSRAHEYGGGAFVVSDGVIYLEQYRSTALSPGCGPAAEPDHARSSRSRCGCVPARRRRHRPRAAAHGLRPGRSHWGRRGDHDSKLIWLQPAPKALRQSCGQKASHECAECGGRSPAVPRRAGSFAKCAHKVAWCFDLGGSDPGRLHSLSRRVKNRARSR